MPAKCPKKTRSFSSELKPLMKFLAEHSKDVKCPLILCKIFSKYRKERNWTASTDSIQRSFRQQLSPIIHTFSEFSDEVLVKILFATSTPVDKQFLSKLRMTAEVSVDDSQRICEYQSESLQLKGKHIPIRGLKRRSADPPSDVREKKTNNNNRKSLPSAFAPGPSPAAPALVSASVTAPAAPRIYQNLPEIDVALSPMNLLGMSAIPELNPICIPMIAQEALMENNFLNMLSVFVNSMTGMMESQQQFMMNMIEKLCLQPLEKKEAPSESSGIPDKILSPESDSESVKTTTSLPNFLNFCKCILSSLDCEELINLSEQYDDYLENLGPEDTKVPIGKLLLALQAIFSISISANVAVVKKPNEKVNAKEFVMLLESYVSSKFNYPEFLEFNQQLKKRIASLSENSRVPIENLKLAFEAALAIVSKKRLGNEHVKVKEEITPE